MKADTFKTSVIKMLGLPLWVKQIIYIYLKTDMRRTLNNRPIDVNPYDLIQLYKPKITFKGKRELQDRTHDHEEMVYTFLKAISENKTMIDITLDSFLTLAETCSLYLKTLKDEYVMPSNSRMIDSTAQFFCSEIKTGEYLYRIGKLTVDQLNNAIRTQDELKQKGDTTPMATVIANLGYIEKDEIGAILIMKEEAKKRLIFNMGVSSAEIEATSDTIQLQKMVAQLTYENNYLKTKLNTMLKTE